MSNAIYIVSKIDNNRYCKTNGQFTRHLWNHNMTYQEYYEKYITGIERKCNCGNPLTFYQQNHTYANSCGDKQCIGKLISITKQNWSDEQKAKDSANKIASQTPEVREAMRISRIKTNRERYGVDYTTQTRIMQDKSKSTKLERYGNEYYSNPLATSKSWKSKTPEEITSITDKKRATCKDRYGVENTFFLPEARKKSAVANSIGREYTLPSGTVIRVRGYEDVAISKLLENYAEADFVLDDTLATYGLPVFSYVNVNLHTMKYYPDVYIPKENKIIEVKGRWWWDGNGLEKYTSRLINNLKKRQAVLVAGYNYEVWLFENKNNYRILKNDADFDSK